MSNNLAENKSNMKKNTNISLSNKSKLKNDILEMIENNPDLIETLSVERLELLNEIYDELIERNALYIKYLESLVS